MSLGFDRKAYMKEYRKKHYAANKDKYIEQAAAWDRKNPNKVKERANRYYHKHREKVLQKIRDNKRKAVELFGGECRDCGGVFPDCVYDFHHLNDDKEANPSVALRSAWEKAIKELEKCVMICSNCHRLRHFQNS